jgi:hypothetical protein
MTSLRWVTTCTAALGFLVVALVSPALAHEEREFDGHTLVVGWLEEPAFAGFKNAMQFIVSHGDGDPVTGAELEVEIVFGDADADERTEPMPLEPAFGTPGEYHAFLIPTRPGTYTFHVSGTLEGNEQLDETFTSGEQTFDDVHEPADVQFPAQDPSTGELAEAVTRLQTRLASAQEQVTGSTEALATARSEAEDAADAASLARLLAIIALVAAVGAVVVALVMRSRTRAPTP